MLAAYVSGRGYIVERMEEYRARLRDEIGQPDSVLRLLGPWQAAADHLGALAWSRGLNQVSV